MVSGVKPLSQVVESFKVNKVVEVVGIIAVVCSAAPHSRSEYRECLGPSAELGCSSGGPYGRVSGQAAEVIREWPGAAARQWFPH